MVNIPSLKLLDGRSMPILGLGTYSSEGSGDREKTEQAVYDGICCGYRHIDTAYLYRVEAEVGRGAKRAIDEGIVKREDLFIVTKIWITNLSRDRLLAQAKESNEKIGLGYIDLLLIHFPTPIEDTGKRYRNLIEVGDDGQPIMNNNIDIHVESWQAMEETVKLGISKSIGVSNYNIKLLKDLLKVATIKPVNNQVECTPYLPRSKLIDFAKEHGITITAWSPFGGGPRFNEDGNSTVSETRIDLWQEPIIKSLAEKYKKTVNQILLRFHIDRGVIVIPKTVTKSRMEENANIFDFSLSPEDLNELAKLECGRKVGDLKGMFPSFGTSKYYPDDDE